MIQEQIKKAVKRSILKLQKQCGCVFDIPDIDLEQSSQERFGDFSTNIAMKLNCKAKSNPVKLAEMIVDNLSSIKDVEKVDVVKPGFINFYLKKNYYYSELKNILKEKEKFGDLNLGKGKKAQVEFISANPTGPLHIGNARGGPIGDVLSNILKKAGYEVEREFFVNDVGGQVERFGKTLVWWYEKKVRKLEKEFPEGGYPGKYYEDLSNKVQKKIRIKLKDKNQKELLDLFIKEGLKISVKEIKDICKEMGINFDNWIYESDIQKKYTSKVVSKLTLKGNTKEKKGALWFYVPGKNEFLEDRECVLLKSDKKKTPTYFISDIAYHWDRFKNKKFDLIFNVWGSGHFGHIGRLKAALTILGINPEKLRIILYQNVALKKGEEIFKMAKREGTYITVDQLLEEVGKDVFRFLMLQKSANTHLNFDLELAKDTSEKNPVYYVKYAHARLSGILKKAKDIKPSKIKYELLNRKEELDLIKKLLKFPEVVKEIVQDHSVQKLPYFAIDLSTKFHSFYDKCRVISNDSELTAARLRLVEATRIVLRNTMDLIGIDAPERM